MFGRKRQQPVSRPATEPAVAPAAGGDDDVKAALGQLAEGRYGAVTATGRLGDDIKALADRLAAAGGETLRGLVNVSRECSQAMVSIAEMTRDVRAVSDRGQAIAAAAEEMVASVRDIASTSEAASEDAQRAQDAASIGAEAAERAVQTMELIARTVQETVAKVNQLAEASSKIGDIVLQIEAIAQQTNLLALNATIEAARAGDAGKGFAVVATEVKSLANQTAKATEDIRTRIENLRSEMSGIVASMEESANAVQEGRSVIGEAGQGITQIAHEVDGISGKMQEIASILSQQSQASDEVSHGIHVIADMANHNVTAIGNLLSAMDRADQTINASLESVARQDIPLKVVEIAKSDHVSFKKRLYQALVGHISLEADKLADHRTCRLGKWYYSVEDSKIRNAAAFRALEGPHDRVHSNGKEMLRRLSQGDLDGAMKALHQVENASEEVLQLLDRLGDEVSGQK